MNRTAQAMATIFGKRATVRGVAAPTPGLRRVHLAGDALRGLRVQPGDKVKVGVGGGAMRSYTPSGADALAGRLEMLVRVRGDSRGSRWALGLRPGDEVRFLGPSHSLDGVVPEDTPWLVFYGDETAAGLAEFILRERPASTAVHGALSLAQPELHIAEGLPLDGLLREGRDHGPALVRHLEAVGRPEGDGLVFPAGEASAVLELRGAALAMGLRREQLRIKPYWSLEKTTVKTIGSHPTAMSCAQ